MQRFVRYAMVPNCGFFAVDLPCRVPSVRLQLILHAVKVKGTRVRELRLAQDLTREQLAVKAGISARTLARVELDEGPTNDSTLAVLALALGCSVSDFTDEEPVAA